jgi:glycosyltransferase involved in cell wall biosynthesis
MSSRPLRVLNVIDNLATGGTQLLSLRTMSELQNRGLEISYVVIGQSSRTTLPSSFSKKATYLESPADYRKPWQVRKITRLLKDKIRDFQPDILHSWLWTSDFITALSNNRGELPHFSHIVDRRAWLESPKIRHLIRRFLTIRAFKQSRTRFFAVSNSAKQFAVKNLHIDSTHVTVTLNSIHTEHFADTPPSLFITGFRTELVLGIASRLEPEKGHVHLLHAVKILKTNGIPIRLLIAGEGGNKTALVDETKRLEISECVHFVGFVDSIPRFLEEIDVFAVPSVDSEGLPTTILESMASGRLVIASNVGGAVEAITDGRNGFIVAPSNARDISICIEKIFHNRNQMVPIIENARDDVVTNFSMDKMCSQIIEAYQHRNKIGLTPNA